jgi:hypothetical protein
MWFLFFVILIAITPGAQHPMPHKTSRLPFQKRQLVFKSPTQYEKRLLRIDKNTGESVYYDPRPRVELLDARSGRYSFKWIGYDGSEKTVIFQRADAIDAVISATVVKNLSGQYVYTYSIKNLPSSGVHLSGFALQTFTSDLHPVKLGSGYVGRMSKNKEMKEGDWIYFGSSNFDRSVTPGQSIELKLFSSSPPGLVECRIHGGDLGMKGVGEDMPQELENVLPSYQDWPSSYTIGPIDKLKTVSPAERAKYILKLLPQFQTSGWMTQSSLQWYEQTLNRNDFEALYKRAGQDLKAGTITSEVFSIIEAMRN